MPSLLGDPPADLSGVIAVRAVLHDFDEQHCDRGIRLQLEAQLISEVMPLTTCQTERVAVTMPPRRGIWFGDHGADGRTLTQKQTDILVRDELFWRDDAGPPDAMLLALGDTGASRSFRFGDTEATMQRGGIDSDPLVRLLAFRAWGYRDIRWNLREVIDRILRTNLCPLPAGHRGRCRPDPTEPHGGAIACGRPLVSEHQLDRPPTRRLR